MGFFLQQGVYMAGIPKSEYQSIWYLKTKEESLQAKNCKPYQNLHFENCTFNISGDNCTKN